MTQDDYFKMCKAAAKRWKDVAILLGTMGYTPSSEKLLKLKYLYTEYPELFNKWKDTDLDPEDMVMEDVFGGENESIARSNKEA